MKKIVGLLLALAMVLSFAGCSPKKSEGSNEFTKTWADYEKAGKIVMGLDVNFPPMGYMDGEKIVGYDVDMAKALGEKLGLEIELMPIDWTMKETELNTGKIDIIWNGYTISDERKEKVNFTPAYLENRQVILVKAGSPLVTKADIAGKTIAVQAGSSAVDAIKSDAATYETIKDSITEYSDNNAVLMEITAGRADAAVMDRVVAQYYIGKKPGEYQLLAEDFGNEFFGIGIRKADKEFYDKFVKALTDMKADGTTAKITKTWFGEDISILQ